MIEMLWRVQYSVVPCIVWAIGNSHKRLASYMKLLDFNLIAENCYHGNGSDNEEDVGDVEHVHRL